MAMQDLVLADRKHGPVNRRCGDVHAGRWGTTGASRPRPCYKKTMSANKRFSPDEVMQSQARRAVAMRLQEIEGNPLSAEDIAMFEMFEREEWTHERRIAYILDTTAALPAE